MSALIAIVGRPNVGKSALFNRIAGRRIAIVHNQPGVTRDRVTAEAEWAGRVFTLVDTGGIGLSRGERARDEITEAALEQVRLAIESAQVILLVVNAQEGVVPLDREASRRLHRCGKPVLVAVNKVDHPGVEPLAGEFAALGFEKVFAVTAIHGAGVADMMDAAIAALPATGVETAAPSDTAEGADAAAPEPAVLKLAIVGRPNVGKSSLINALTHSPRVIVSAVPGTTRDAVDVPFEIAGEEGGPSRSCVLIDTAGMRKSRRVGDSVEFFSVKRSEDAVERCDIAVLVLDAESGILEQDKKIADLITAGRKACIVVVNKWDLVAESVRQARLDEIQRRQAPKTGGRNRDKPMTTLVEFGQWVQKHLFFLDYAPVVFTSARDGFHLDRLLEAVRYVADQLRQRVPTSILNRTLHDAVASRQPVSSKGHQLKFYYATQTLQAPPTFLLFVNRADLFTDAYAKYLAGCLRVAFGYEGCPIVLHARPRPKTVESLRRHSRSKASEA